MENRVLHSTSEDDKRNYRGVMWPWSSRGYPVTGQGESTKTIKRKFKDNMSVSSSLAPIAKSSGPPISFGGEDPFDGHTNVVKGVKYTTWLSNVVLLKRSNVKWCMCVNYIDLNNSYPPDTLPLPNIDKLVDNLFGFRLMLIIDAY